MSTSAFSDARPLGKLFRLAVVSGISRAVQVHIDRGDDLNARDSKGLTPLMLAAARNKDAICKLLLDAGADGSLQDPSGKTAHDIAVAARAHDAASVIAASKVQSPNQVPTEDSKILEVGVLGGREEFAFSAAENQDIGHPPAAAGLALGITDPSLHPERHAPFSTENLLGEESAILIVSEPARTAQADEEKDRIDIDLDNDPVRIPANVTADSGDRDRLHRAGCCALKL